NGDSGFGNGGLTGANAALIIHGSRIHDNAAHGINAVHAGIEDPTVVEANRINHNSGRSALAHAASDEMAYYTEGDCIDTPTPDRGNIVGGSWSGGGADLDGTADAITFSTQPGEELAVGQGSFRFVAPRAGTLVGVTAAVGDPPTGDDVIVDVNKNGVT